MAHPRMPGPGTAGRWGADGGGSCGPLRRGAHQANRALAKTGAQLARTALAPPRDPRCPTTTARAGDADAPPFRRSNSAAPRACRQAEPPVSVHDSSAGNSRPSDMPRSTSPINVPSCPPCPCRHPSRRPPQAPPPASPPAPPRPARAAPSLGVPGVAVDVVGVDHQVGEPEAGPQIKRPQHRIPKQQISTRSVCVIWGRT